MKNVKINILLSILFWQISASAFDHKHAVWGQVLGKCVVSEGATTRVRYLELAKDKSSLESYLASVSAVTRAEYDGWSATNKLAFLFNAYNAFTVKLIVEGISKKPSLMSIKELGSLFTNPWNIKFFKLFGQDATLDMIEQKIARPNFDEPRMHMAFNCASIGCPALNRDPFVGDSLDAQLESAAKTFLSDVSRNAFDPIKSKLKLSPIFEWYGKDFEVSKKLGPLNHFLAERIPVGPKYKDLIAAGKISVEFLDYNWNLNIQH